MSDIEAIRARHFRRELRAMEPDPERPGYLRRGAVCDAPDHDETPAQWPCDTAQVFTALDEARALVEGRSEDIYRIIETIQDERDAARADAGVLAVRFSTMSLAWHDQFHDDRRGTYEACKHVPCVSDRAALAAHEAQR